MNAKENRDAEQLSRSFGTGLFMYACIMGCALGALGIVAAIVFHFLSIDPTKP